MAHVKVTDEDIETLEAKADLAYDTLKRAVETEDETQKSALLFSAECLYEHDLGAYLRELTVKATHSFRRLNKGGKRARKIERYILQYVLMHSKSRKSDTYKMEIVWNPDDGMGGLQAYLDAEDDRSSEEGEVFRLIQHKAAELRKNKKYDFILKALDYVREKYQRPKL